MSRSEGAAAPALGSSAPGLAQALFDQSPFSSVLYDASGHPVALNAAFTALWGARLEDVPPGYTVLTDPQLEKQGIIPAIRRAFAGEAVMTPPVRYSMAEASATGKGRTIWTEAHFHPIRDVDGTVTHVVLTHVDITARMTAELALRDAVDRTTLLQSVTAAFARALTADEVASITLAESVRALGASVGLVYLLAPDAEWLDLTGHHGVIGAALDSYRRIPISADRPGAEATRTRAPIYFSDSAAVARRYNDVTDFLDVAPAESWATLPLIQSGTTLGVFILGFPERREFTAADRALLESFGQQCAQALERARLYDSERDARRAAERTAERLAALQRGTGELSGAITPGEVADVIIRSALPPLGAPRFALALLDHEQDALEVVGAAGYPPAVLERYRFIPIETQFPLCDVVRTGEPVLLPSASARAARYPQLVDLRSENGSGSMAAFPLRADGRIIGALGFNWTEEHAFSPDDIAFLDVLSQQCGQAIERARLYEEERRARTEAEQANRAKGDFLAAMSHELRTPLNGIGGYVELLDMGLRGPITDAQRADLDRIRRNQQHLLLLIEDVLSFARVEAGHLEVDDAPVAVDETLRSLEAMIIPQVTSKGVHFLYEQCDPALRARGDRDRIVQVGANLLANAIKATPAGGRVILSAVADDEHVRISVADSGVGIPADKLDAIFLPFTQLGRSLRNPRAGAGLGLSISRALATAMGGALEVESTEGEGSTFTLTLRRDHGPPGRARALPDAPA
ncbi:MAG: GAF domain-containing protein [Gemmatimonadaceae bacterium]